MPTQTDPILAIILSPRRITAAELCFVDGQLRVSALGDVEPPDGAFDGGQVANGESIGRALSGFLAEKQVAAREAVILLPGATAITQLIKLPAMPREDMLGAVRAVAERYAVFAEHKVAVDCAIVEELEEDGKQMSSVLLSASREANVEQCQESARTAGLELLSVEVVPVVAARAYREALAASDVVALAVVGETKTDVMIFDQGVCRLCYSANVAFPEETETGDWMSPIPEQRDPFAPPPQLYSELTHCFRFFQNQFPRRAVQRVIMAIDHPRADLIVSHLSEQLQLPVELGRPTHDLHLPSDVDREAAANARSLTLALLRGAALPTLGDTQALFRINLIPESSTIWRPVRPYMKLALAAMGLVLLASLFWAWSLRNKINSQEQRLEIAKGRIAVLQPQIDALRAAQATELALRTEVERQTASLAKERAVRWSQILVDVAQRLPGDMWLTRIASPDSSKISLAGISTNRESIPDAIQSLSGSPYLDRVVLGSLAKDDTYAPGSTVIRYQINARLLRGLLPPTPSPAEATPEPPAEPPEEEPAPAAPAEPTPETQEAEL